MPICGGAFFCEIGVTKSEQQRQMYKLTDPG